MRVAMAMVLLVAGGCKDPGEILAEKAVEVASGGKVKVDGETVTITDDEGKEVTTTITDRGVKGVVTNEESVEATYSADESGVKVETAEGTATWGSKEIPSGFPLPVIDGAEVGATASSKKKGGQTGYHVTLSTDQSPAEVASFYQKALQDAGMKVRRQQHTVGGTEMVILAGSKGKKKKKRTQAAVNATREKGEGKTDVMITWSAP